MTWMYPPAYADTLKCDNCGDKFLEEDAQEIEPYVYVCPECYEHLLEQQQQMEEMAQDDKAHAEMDRRAGL